MVTASAKPEPEMRTWNVQGHVESQLAWLKVGDEAGEVGRACYPVLSLSYSANAGCYTQVLG